MATEMFMNFIHPESGRRRDSGEITERVSSRDLIYGRETRLKSNIGLSRRKPRGMIILVVVSMLTALSASVAQAALSPSTFEGNDGNQTHLTGGTDWDNVAGKVNPADKPAGKTDNSFGQGTKED